MIRVKAYLFAARTNPMRCLSSFIIACLVSSGSTVVADDVRIAGYLPDYRLADYDLARCNGITDLILFSGEATADGGIDLKRLAAVPWAQLQRFKTERRIRLFLTIGGWDRSKHFGVIARSEELRDSFATHAKDLCLRYRLDGIDIDWEHPESDAEVEAYGLLLQQLHQALSEHGLLLSVTIASWQTVPRTGIDSVNWVNLMAYDHDGEHSTLSEAKADVQRLLDRGIPAEKITLGLPFYGRDVQKRETAMSYAEIVNAFHPSKAQDRSGQMFFNGPETIRAKVALARQQKLAGVMIWELGQDATGEDSLLHHVLEASQ